MTSLPIGKDIAIRFLKASVEGGAKPGDILGPHLFRGPVHLPGVMADFPAAMDYAAQERWVEKLAGDQYCLTSAGHIAAQSGSN
jgi:hypothetical protein